VEAGAKQNVQVVIEKVGEVWRAPDVHVKPGHAVTWTVHGSAGHLQCTTENMFEGEEWSSFSIPPNGSRSRKLSGSLPPGEYHYSVFIQKDLVFAEGSSPPKLIVP
jgi:plastocyanin